MDLSVYRMSSDECRRLAYVRCEQAGYVVGFDDDGGIFLVVDHPGGATDADRVPDAVLSVDPSAVAQD
jgi:hypothetical protein